MQLSDAEYVQVTREWLMGVQGAGQTAGAAASLASQPDNGGASVATALLTQPSVSRSTTKVAVRPVVAASPSLVTIAPPRVVPTPTEERPDLEEIHRVLDIVAQKPDTRDTVVASLRARIESGEYHVSGEEIAQMMLRRFLADTLS